MSSQPVQLKDSEQQVTRVATEPTKLQNKDGQLFSYRVDNG